MPRSRREIIPPTPEMLEAQAAMLRRIAERERNIRLDYPPSLRAEGRLLSREDYDRLGYDTVCLMLTYYAWPFLNEHARDKCRSRRPNADA
jgi:hypothetical protein